MKCTLLGIEGVDYTKKDGNRVCGLSLHCSRPAPSSKSNVVKGLVTEQVWIGSQNPLFDRVRAYPVPAQIDVQYELNGKFAELVDVILIKEGGESK